MRVRLLGHPGVQGAQGRGTRDHPGQQQPGDDHDRPGAGGSHLHRTAHTRGARSNPRAREAGRAPAHGRRPDGAQPGGCARRERRAGAPWRRADRRVGRSHQGRRGSAEVPRRHEIDRRGRAEQPLRAVAAGSARCGRAHRVPRHHPSLVHARRRRRRHRLQHRGVPRAGGPRDRPQPGARGAARGIGDRLERVRARGDARSRRQLRRHLLDRERRSDGRPHRRQHHRGAGADADRSRVSAHARSGAAHHPPRRRRNRRLQHPVRDQPGGWPDHRHRDEPARVAFLGARLEGHRVPDRQDCRQAGARLSPRRDSERHHAADAGVVRADD